jgi:hypothetical protein
MIHLALYIVSTVIVAVAALFVLSLGMGALVGIANLFIKPKFAPVMHTKLVTKQIVYQKTDRQLVFIALGITTAFAAVIQLFN